MKLNFFKRQSKILVLVGDVKVTQTGIEYSFENRSKEALFDNGWELMHYVNGGWTCILPRDGDVIPDFCVTLNANTFFEKVRSEKFPTLSPGRYMFISSYIRVKNLPIQSFTKREYLKIKFNIDENTPYKLPKRPLPDGMVEELSEDGMMVSISLNDI